jgi:hypothetical protein
VAQLVECLEALSSNPSTAKKKTAYRMKNFFDSYSSDKGLISRIYKELKKLGLETWLQEVKCLPCKSEALSSNPNQKEELKILNYHKLLMLQASA